MPDSNSNPLFILGMHRSGTSMLASLLQDAGVFIGEHLIGAEIGNERGHFEDRDLYEFHCAALARARDKDWRFFDDGTLGLESFEYVPTDDELAKAHALIANRRREGWWGWKEPRTCLFLDFWAGLIPDARAIVIYRHPLEVHLSHLRRGVNIDLALRPAQALHAYTLYNQKILEGIQREPSRYLVVNANAGFAQRPALNAAIASFLKIEESSIASAGDFHAGEFRGIGLTAVGHQLFGLIFPSAARAFDALQSCSAIPAVFAVDTEKDAMLREWYALLSPLVQTMGVPEREQLLPLVEVLLGSVEAPKIASWKQEMAGAIVGKYTEYREWAEKSIQEQEEYRVHQTKMLEIVSAEKEQLGAAVQSEIDRTRHIWDELVNVGKDWHAKVDHINGLTAHNETLTKRITELEQEVKGLKAAGRAENPFQS